MRLFIISALALCLASAWPAYSQSASQQVPAGLSATQWRVSKGYWENHSRIVTVVTREGTQHTGLLLGAYMTEVAILEGSTHPFVAPGSQTIKIWKYPDLRVVQTAAVNSPLGAVGQALLPLELASAALFLPLHQGLLYFAVMPQIVLLPGALIAWPILANLPRYQDQVYFLETEENWGQFYKDISRYNLIADPKDLGQLAQLAPENIGDFEGWKQLGEVMPVVRQTLAVQRPWSVQVATSGQRLSLGYYQNIAAYAHSNAAVTLTPSSVLGTGYLSVHRHFKNRISVGAAFHHWGDSWYRGEVPVDPAILAQNPTYDPEYVVEMVTSRIAGLAWANYDLIQYNSLTDAPLVLRAGLGVGREKVSAMVFDVNPISGGGIYSTLISRGQVQWLLRAKLEAEYVITQRLRLLASGQLGLSRNLEFPAIALPTYNGDVVVPAYLIRNQTASLHFGISYAFGKS